MVGLKIIQITSGTRKDRNTFSTILCSTWNIKRAPLKGPLFVSGERQNKPKTAFIKQKTT